MINLIFNYHQYLFQKFLKFVFLFYLPKFKLSIVISLKEFHCHHSNLKVINFNLISGHHSLFGTELQQAFTQAVMSLSYHSSQHLVIDFHHLLQFPQSYSQLQSIYNYEFQIFVFSGWKLYLVLELYFLCSILQSLYIKFHQVINP